MYKPLTLLAALFIIAGIQAQNVGIGTTTPVTKFHIRAASDSLVLLENTQNMVAGVTNGLNFKTYQLYTGGIRTIATGPVSSRLGLFLGPTGYASQMLERLSILDDGKVGIGTTTPLSKLHIMGSSASPTIPGAGSTGALRLQFGTGGTNAIDFGKSSASPYAAWIQSGSDGSEDPMVLQPLSGNLGIGTLNPTTKVQIGDYSNPNDTYLTIKTAGGNLYKAGIGLYHYNDTYGWLLESDETAGRFSIRHRNSSIFNNQVFTIDYYDRVGIGTVNPTTKLQVGDYSNAFNNYITVKTGGGSLYKAGIGLYHYSDNYGWLLESNEAEKTFAINSRYANFNVFTIDGYTGNFGICNDPLPHGRLRVTAGAMDFGLYIEGEYSNQAALYARGRSWFDVGAKQAIINGTGNGGASTDPNAYLLEVYGGQQGISVGINSSQAHEGNNYLLFYDNGGVRGSIAAQNLSELHSAWEYSFWHTLQLLSAAFIAAEAAACGLQADVWEVGVLIGETIDYIANYANEVGHMETEVGVVYQSNAADYAEWLEREDPNEQLGPGMIVGVNGGRISKHTSGSKQLMVISTAPLVLGNTPPERRASAFEKVAFMGQVPVRVRGKVDIGDYILASGENDGMGIAVAPSKMQLEDYDKVVGVAWSSSKYSNSEFMIKTAVGLNTHDLIGEIRQQKTEVQQLKETLQGVMDYLKQKDPQFKLTMPGSQNSYATTVNSSLPVESPLIQPKRNYSSAELSDAYETLRKNPEFVDEILKKAKEKCISRGININIESLKGFFDRETFLQEVKKAMTIKAALPKGLRPVKAEPFKLIEPTPVKNQ